MYNCVSIWTPNQVEWPSSIRSELHVERLKKPKHAVHDGWLGTFLMIRIKIVFNSHKKWYNMYSTDILVIEFPYGKHTIYMIMCHTNHVPYELLSAYAMTDDPCIDQYSGHAYPCTHSCTNAQGLFTTDID